jgi:hypothetical protein
MHSKHTNSPQEDQYRTAKIVLTNIPGQKFIGQEKSKAKKEGNPSYPQNQHMNALEDQRVIEQLFQSRSHQVVF